MRLHPGIGYSPDQRQSGPPPDNWPDKEGLGVVGSAEARSYNSSHPGILVSVLELVVVDTLGHAPRAPKIYSSRFEAVAQYSPL